MATSRTDIRSPVAGDGSFILPPVLIGMGPPANSLIMRHAAFLPKAQREQEPKVERWWCNMRLIMIRVIGNLIVMALIGLAVRAVEKELRRIC